MRISHGDFDRLVEEALSELPPQFAKMLDNVVVIVEEEPSDDDLDLLEDEEGELLGIYRGVARTRRTYDMLPTLPDQIAIFRGPILRVVEDHRGDRRDIVREVRDTVIHELGHYFGLDDHEMPY